MQLALWQRLRQGIFRPCEKCLPYRFCVLHAIGSARFIVKLLLLTGTLYSKKPVAVGKANGCLGMFGIRILWQGFQRLIEFSSGMGHAADRNHLRPCVCYLMVSCIAVCLQIAMESRKKCFRDFSASGGLIFIKDNGLLRVTASASV